MRMLLVIMIVDLMVITGYLKEGHCFEGEDREGLVTKRNREQAINRDRSDTPR